MVVLFTCIGFCLDVSLCWTLVWGPHFKLSALGSICLIALLLSRLEVWGYRGPCSILLFAVCPYSFPKTASLLSVNAWSQNNSILVLIINRWPETNVNPGVLCWLWYSNTEAGGDISRSSSLAGLSCKRSVYAPLLRSSDLNSVVKTNPKLEALCCDYATRSCGIFNEWCLPRLPPSSHWEKRSRTEQESRQTPTDPPSPKCDMWGNICSAINITVITHCLLKRGFGRVRDKHFHLRDTWPMFGLPGSAFGAMAPVAVTEAPRCLLGLRPLRNQGGDSQRDVINHRRESNRCGDVQEWGGWVVNNWRGGSWGKLGIRIL